MTIRTMYLAVFTLLTACASAPDVQTSVAPGADPAKYRTFTFAQANAGATGAITDNRVHDRVRYMIAEQLVSRGYFPAPPGQAADLGVHFAGHVDPKHEILVVGRPGPYTYGWGPSEVGGYQSVDYRQGTLFVDVFHVEDRRLLWRARISDTSNHEL